MTARRRLLLYFTGNALFAAGIAFHAFLYNYYLEALGLSPVSMGRAAAALSFGGLLALLPAGWGVDRWGARSTTLASALIVSLGLGLGAIVREPALIYMTSALIGVAGTSWRVAQAPILMELTTAENRSRVFAWDVALLIGGGAAATALAGPLVPALEHNLAWTHSAALTGAMLVGALITATSAALYATIALPAGRALSERPAAAAPIPIPTLALVGLSGLWLAALVLAAPFFNIYFTRTFALPLERVSGIFGAVTMATAVLVAGAGEIATRWGSRRAFTGWLLLFGPAMWGLALAPTVGVAVICYLLQNLVSPAANPLLDQLLLESIPMARRGTISSWRQALANGGQAAAQFAGGSVLAATSFPILFGLAGGMGLISGVGVAWLAWRVGRSP